MGTTLLRGSRSPIFTTECSSVSFVFVWHACPTVMVFSSRLQGAILTTMLATRNFSSKYDTQGEYLRPSSALHGPRQTVLLYLLLNFMSPCLCLRIRPPEPSPNPLSTFRRLFVLHSRHRGSVHLPFRSFQEVLHDMVVRAILPCAILRE